MGEGGGSGGGSSLGARSRVLTRRFVPLVKNFGCPGEGGRLSAYVCVCAIENWGGGGGGGGGVREEEKKG